MSIPVVQDSPDVPTSIEWVYIFLDGGISMALSFVALSIGPSLISAPEVSLCTLLETAVAPVWVFLAGYEKPSGFAIGGGVALVVALVIHRYSFVVFPPLSQYFVLTNYRIDVALSQSMKRRIKSQRNPRMIWKRSPQPYSD